MVDDVFELYKDHLTGDEEDVLVIIYGILDGFKSHELDKLYQDLKAEEKFEMIALYLYEKLRLKMFQEGIGHISNGDDQDNRLLH
ncbi:DUF6154 family protein [Anaerobacillus arseniciselenatis]|nr:DUF6154 family protein [Anaerobacillus arseniciselenatis]